MDARAEQALKRYQENGAGSAVTREDRDAIEEYMIAKMTAAGVPYPEARDLVSAHYWGAWSEGWTTGYGSARAHYAPHFSLSKEA